MPPGQTLSFVGARTNKGTPLRLYRVAAASSCLACPVFGVCTKEYRRGRAWEVGPHDAALRRHRDWMATEAAQAAYRRRLPLIEPLFGILKHQLGSRQCTLRGLANGAAEWTMLATAFNLRTLWRVWRTRIPLHWPRPAAHPVC